MLDQSDASLYAAKRNGRNQVVCFDRMPTEITERAKSDRRKTFAPQPDKTSEKLDVIPFEAVSALLSVLSFRDAATAEHSHRVADLCVQIGEKLLSKAECYRLEVAALLHDIGKVGVPDAILWKSGELNADEWQLMDQHEQMGVEIVRKAFASQQLAEIIQNYRAWFNGCSRNPALPAGNAIPMEARILAIADAWDSMTTSRPWRPGRTFESATAELRRCAGSQFDAEYVEQFFPTGIPIRVVPVTPGAVICPAGRRQTQSVFVNVAPGVRLHQSLASCFFMKVLQGLVDRFEVRV
jgi:putative nucleotidyltransferase with HDIG domain